MLEEIIEIIGEFVDVEGIEITEETSLKNDLGMNSFDYISVATALESKYEIDIPDNIIGSVKTVGDIANLIKEKKAD